MKKTRVVNLNTVENIKSFCKAAAACNSTVVVRRGIFAVDGSSIMGLFSLDLSENATVEYDDTEIEFDNFINTL